jgi:LysM repeat protein
MKPYLHISLIAALCLAPFLPEPQVQAQSAPEQIPLLESLAYTDPGIKELREGIRSSIFVVKSRRPASEMPQIRFYRYRVAQGDSFWTILSRTSQNIDTLMSINNLTNPADVVAGKILYIPNMRGVVHNNARRQSAEEIGAGYRVSGSYIETVNGNGIERKPWVFVPCGEIPSEERSLFMGTAFKAPLEVMRRTSGFGSRRDPFTGSVSFHGGMDFACVMGTPVYASRAGVVRSSGVQGGYGLLIEVAHNYNYSTLYGHLSRSVVSPGQSVRAGELIGYSGNSGRSTDRICTSKYGAAIRRSIRAICCAAEGQKAS